MKKYKLGDLIDVNRGTSLSGKFYANTGKYIRLTLGNFDYKLNVFKENTSKEDVYYIGNFNKKYLLKKGDIITPLTEQVKGLIGSTARIPEDNKYIQSQDVALLKSVSSNLNNNFLYYLLSSNYVRLQLSNIAQQTKIRHTSPEKIQNAIVYLPKLSDQKKISGLLDNINNKIGINNKIISESEKLVKKIYDYWFIQFEFPDKDGNSYRSSGGKMIYNEMLKRKIPENWKVEKIKNCIKSINTGLNPRNNFKLGNGSIKYVTVKNLTINGNIDFSDCDVIDDQARMLIHNRSQLTKGDILFASISPLGRCVIVNEDPKDWDINESVFCIKPNFDKISSEYLYLYFMGKAFIKKAEHSSTGSVFNGIRINTLENMPILVPQKQVIENFTNVILDVFKMKYSKLKENEELKDLKKFLLPLLMNEQVRFKD